MLHERPFSLERRPQDPDVKAIAIMTSAIRAGWSDEQRDKRMRVDCRRQRVNFQPIVFAPVE
jgi:hypothetical protein